MTKRKSRVKLPPRDIMRGKQYPGLRGKVVDWVDHAFEDDVLLSRESARDGLSERRRSALFLFYVSALVSAIAITLAEKIPSLRAILLALAVAGAGIAILFLLRFLRSNDEREQQVTLIQ